MCASVCAAIIQADKPKAISKGNKNDNRSQFPYCLHEFYIQLPIRIRIRFRFDLYVDLDLNLPALPSARFDISTPSISCHLVAHSSHPIRAHIKSVT